VMPLHFPTGPTERSAPVGAWPDDRTWIQSQRQPDTVA
jgi:hypothetical protein